MKKFLIAISFVLTLSGCGPEPDTRLHTGVNPEQPQIPSRFSITRVGVFQDELAYYNKRGIYILKDLKTGKEYVGISGVGISEVRQAGKTIAEE